MRKTSSFATHQKTFVSALLAFGLASCALPQERMGPMIDRHPIEIAESIERLELYPRQEGMQLSQRDQYAVLQFLAQYAKSGTGSVHINSPSDSSTGARQAESLVAENLSRLGISGQNLVRHKYQSNGEGFAPVIVSYKVLKTLPKNCGAVNDLTQTYNNEVHKDFGCATASNFATMLADPKQLVEPYPFGSPDLERRTIVYDSYIDGDDPSSVRQNVSSKG